MNADKSAVREINEPSHNSPRQAQSHLACQHRAPRSGAISFHLKRTDTDRRSVVLDSPDVRATDPHSAAPRPDQRRRAPKLAHRLIPVPQIIPRLSSAGQVLGISELGNLYCGDVLVACQEQSRTTQRRRHPNRITALQELLAELLN